MFKDESAKTSKNIETIIGPSVKVEGDFFGEGDVVVEGIVTGNLKTKNHLKVMEGAKIQAEVEAKSAFIAGEILGNVTVSDELELTSSSKVKGDLTANLLSVEKGATINGKISMGSAQSVKPIEKKGDDKEE